MSEEDLIEELRAEADACRDQEGLESATAGLFDRAADALEAATRERDAAVAAIERVRAIHKPVDILAGADFRQARECSVCGDDEPLRYPCLTVAALDGAPEPEVKP